MRMIQSMEYDPNPASPAPSRRRPGRVLAASAVLLAIAVLLLILSVTQARRPAAAMRQNGFLPAEEDAFFSAAGNGLAVAGHSGGRLYSASGKSVAEQEAKMISPVCVGSSLLSAYYDTGQSGLFALYPDGSVQSLSTDGAVTFVDVNETGLVTVLLENTDGRMAVLVLDTDLTPLFRWDVGRGIPLVGRTFGEDLLCVSSVDRDGCYLHFFRIDRPEEQHLLSFPGEILLDLDFLSDGTLAAVLEDRLVFVDEHGELRSSVDYSGSHPEAWFLSGDFAAVATVSGLGGGSGTLTAVSSDGTLLGSCGAPLHVRALSGEQGELLVLYDGGESTLYDRELTELISYQPEADVDQVFLTPKGMAYFAGPSGVTLVDFGR